MDSIGINRFLRPAQAILLVAICMLSLPHALSSVNNGAHVKGLSWTTGGTMHKTTETVAVQGNYAYTGVGRRLVVLDVASPGMPIEVGGTGVPEGFVSDVAVTENKAYVAAGGGGLRIMDISETFNPKEMGFIDTPGYAEGVAVVGNYAYVADGGAGLRVVDVSNPIHPREIGFVYTLGYAFDVVVVGNYAYVASAGAGLRVVDISNPAHPTEVGAYDTPGYAYGVAVAGNMAYVADGWEGLHLVDVSNPAYPTEVGFYDTPGWAFDVAVVGNSAYVADAFAGVRVIDVSDQTHPIEIGAYESPGDIHNVAIVGSVVYAADRRCGLRVIQTSTPSHPTQLGFCRLGDVPEVDLSGDAFSAPSTKPRGQNLTCRPDRPQADQLRLQPMLSQKRDAWEVDMRLEAVGQIGGPTQAVAASGCYAYVGIGLRVEVLDVSDSAAPRQVGSTGVLNGFVSDVSVDSDYVYVTAGGGGLWVVDISDPTSPDEIGFLRTPGYAEGVDVAGSYAYVAAGGAGLRVVDISDPTHPKEISFVYTLGYAFDVKVVGNVAYIAGAGAGLRVVDISDPAHPTEVGGHDTPGYAYGVAVAGSTVYVADGWEGLQVIDVSDPTQPTEVGVYDTPGQAFGVAVFGSIAYVADAFAGLRVVDISDPAQPIELDAYEVSGGHAGDVAVAESTAYVADRNWGLRVLDVSDPTTPTQVGFYGLLGYARDVAVAGNYAFVAAGHYGLRVVEVSTPAHPREIGVYPTQTYAMSVALSENYAYLTTAAQNLHVVDISDPLHPTRVGTYHNHGVGWYRDMAVVGGIAYMANEVGLELISVFDPTYPIPLGFINLADPTWSAYPSCTVGVDVSGNLAYVADSFVGFKIVDVSDPSNPKLLVTCDTDFAQDVAVTGDYAYVADYGGLRIVDVSDPTQPAGMGFYDTPGTTYGVTVVEEIAYVADGGGGVSAINVSTPLNPTLAGFYNTLGYTHQVAVVGDYAYVADGDGGLLILEKRNINLANHESRVYRDATGLCSGALHTGSTYIVTSTLDSGPRTLRWCMENAVSGDTITFDSSIFPPTSPVTIAPSSALPRITCGNLTIDASQAGVILDGHNTPPGTSGLEINSDGNTIRGLQILYFPRDGISVGNSHNTIGGDRTVGIGPSGEGNVVSANGGWNAIFIWGSDNIVSGNLVGTDVTGAVALGNGGGIVIFGQRNLIGGTTVGSGNIISSNVGSGISLCARDNNEVVENIIIGNFIGTDISGTEALGNKGKGIFLVGDEGVVSLNRIGGTLPGERNIISGNEDYGITMLGKGVNDNIVVGNYIGTDVSGTIDIGNWGTGVSLEAGPFNNFVERNLISGNGRGGIIIDGVDYNVVIGNFVGTDATGTSALGNDWTGVYITGAFNKIGGTTAIERNVISGNERGIIFGGVGNIVIGNYIGTDASGMIALGNQNGIEFEGKRGFVGGMTEGERNIISGNRINGIALCASGVEYNWIAGNYFGIDASGTAAMGNSGFGIFIVGAPSNYIGPGNIIANNGCNGISVHSSSATGNTITRNSITNNAGPGIDNESGGNTELAPPVITSTTATSVSGTAPPNCTVEIFSDPENEGKVYKGTTSSDSTGAFTFTKPEGLTGPNVTATATDAAGNTSEFSAAIPTGVEEDLRCPIPARYALFQNYPNPSNPSTAIRYQLPKASGVRLIVYNLLGQEIRRLVDGKMETGYHLILWDGRDNSGRVLASGIYLYCLQAGGFTETKKMAILK